MKKQILTVLMLTTSIATFSETFAAAATDTASAATAQPKTLADRAALMRARKAEMAKKEKVSTELAAELGETKFILRRNLKEAGEATEKVFINLDALEAEHGRAVDTVIAQQEKTESLSSKLVEVRNAAATFLQEAENGLKTKKEELITARNKGEAAYALALQNYSDAKELVDSANSVYKSTVGAINTLTSAMG